MFCSWSINFQNLFEGMVFDVNLNSITLLGHTLILIEPTVVSNTLIEQYFGIQMVDVWETHSVLY